MSLKSNIIAAALFLVSGANQAAAAPAKYNMSGKITGASGYTVLLVQKNGATKSKTLGNSGAFSFKKLTLSQLKGASLQLIDTEGRYAGPVVLGTKSSKAAITFSGKAPTAGAFQLGKISLKSGYATLKKTALEKVAYAKPNVPTVSGKPIGAGERLL